MYSSDRQFVLHRLDVVLAVAQATEDLLLVLAQCGRRGVDAGRRGREFDRQVERLAVNIVSIQPMGVKIKRNIFALI